MKTSIPDYRQQVNTANSNIKKLEERLSSTVDSVNVLKNELALTNNNLKAVANKLELQMQQLSDKSDSDFSALSKRVSNNTIYWILAIVAMALFSAILFSWLRSQVNIGKNRIVGPDKKYIRSYTGRYFKT